MIPWVWCCKRCIWFKCFKVLKIQNAYKGQMSTILKISLYEVFVTPKFISHQKEKMILIRIFHLWQNANCEESGNLSHKSSWHVFSHSSETPEGKFTKFKYFSDCDLSHNSTWHVFLSKFFICLEPEEEFQSSLKPLE